ncbi:TonB-dependent receptor [Echinicola soli]|uniref:TonB-dependent receptor n=1 Tax=Echinicola soli TaxID=2591634 RepID=A0A514CLQ6_9BACT|nr:TonB-dependent receptor [Echinicola soli]QDH80763.1 TonB-dependent receptor [Echinicola soli]
MKKYLAFIFLLVAYFSVDVAKAQGVIKGRVIDNQNLSLPGASVMVTALNKATITDQSGDFLLVGLPHGEYEVTVSYLGYEGDAKKVTVKQGVVSETSFQLTPGYVESAEFVVLGDRLKGQAKALNQQKNNANITNIVSSDQIGRFPDANIGDALKRVPGITMQNDQGEARDIIIRGMAPQLNSVTLNGERIPSAEGDNRRVQMDLIPSDMIQTIEVNKAVLPSMDADAIGGSVNLVTRKAPNGLRISGTAATGLNLLSEKPIWTGSMILGDRLLDDKLGVILSASYNNHNFGSDDVEAVWYESDNGIALEEMEVRKYLVQRVRRSVSLSLDYDLTPNHTLMFSSMYNHRDDWENRFAMKVDELDEAFDGGNFEEVSPGVFNTVGRVEYQTKGGLGSDRINNKRLEDQRVQNFTLGGDHLFNSLKMDWSVTYAKASEERPHERYIGYRSGGQDVRVDITDPRKPFAALINRQDNLGLELDELTEEYGYTFDEDLNGKLDFKLPYSDKGLLQFGGRYRSKYKYRNNNYYQYSPVDEGAFGATLGDVPHTDQSDPDFLPGSQYQIGTFVDPEFVGSQQLTDAGQFEGELIYEEFVPGNYTANETIQAAYIMADHQFTDKLSAIAGVRWEYTDISYTGNLYDVEEEAYFQERAGDSYHNFMPGVHFKYDMDANTIVRLAWTNTIARPNYYDLVPYAEYNAEDDELATGNPNLKPTTSMNVDLMAEKYYDNVGLISIGGFYKDIDQFIYSITDLDYSHPVFGDNLEYTRPENGGTANVYGLEASFQKQIWKGLGLYLNYTFTKSETTGIEGREEENLMLPGTAQNMFNASLSYETQKLVVRASLNYASDYIDELGGSTFEDRYYDRQTFLDINASYAFTPKWRVFFEGNNLTNQPLRYYQGIRSRTMQAEYYNARFNLGVKFDLFN